MNFSWCTECKQLKAFRSLIGHVLHKLETGHYLPNLFMCKMLPLNILSFLYFCQRQILIFSTIITIACAVTEIMYIDRRSKYFNTKFRNVMHITIKRLASNSVHLTTLMENYGAADLVKVSAEIQISTVKSSHSHNYSWWTLTLWQPCISWLAMYDCPANCVIKLTTSLSRMSACACLKSSRCKLTWHRRVTFSKIS